MRFHQKFPAAYISVRRLTLTSATCVLVGGVLAGCASVDNSLRMTPSTSISASKISYPIKPTELPHGIILYSVEEDGTLQQIPDLTGFSAELYVTVDVSGVTKDALKGTITLEERNRIVSFLIYLSDRNADVWMSRTYALNKFRKGTIGTTRDLATAGAGISSLIIPPVAAGLSAFNLLAGTTSDEIDATLYSKETVETLLKAISAARRDERNKIKSNLVKDYRTYDMFCALDQIRYYDSLVSFRKGLAYLGNLADQKNQETQTNSTSTAVIPVAAP